ncbi:Aste57867_6038 [Aphanomyces stellatus]|uniref:Aste57867_6038 protein n=1 Tax=Aphanomyces stellatus TaxID=120398 RepID=A0A485KH23_9STRA|nr:hypothetical protein As57867_006024 [Aphanomyces stellatus]VFT83051.1 Aste57867_6038 [Aphanomyces stellatus]
MASLLEAPPPPPSETALVVSNPVGVASQEPELPVDLMQLPPIPLQKSLLLLTNFCTNTVRFINHFSSLCEDRLSAISKNLTRLEISLAILEAKLNSIPDLPATATISAADIPGDINLPDATPTPPPPPPPPGPAPDDAAAPPPPPPPPSSSGAAPPDSVGGPPPPPESNLLKLKDDPMYAKYFTMQRLGMPIEVVRHKMLMDGMDPDIMSLDPEGPSPSASSLVPVGDSTALTIAGPPPPPPPPPSGPSAAQDDLSPSMAALDLPPPPPPPPSFSPPLPPPLPSFHDDAAPLPPPSSSSLPPPAIDAADPPPAAAPTFLKLKDDPEFEKYFKMRKLGMPDGVIQHKLMMDGITLDILSMDPEGPSPNGGTAAPPAHEDDDDF